MFDKKQSAVLLAATLATGAAQAQISDDVTRSGIINDRSGVREVGMSVSAEKPRCAANGG